MGTQFLFMMVPMAKETPERKAELEVMINGLSDERVKEIEEGCDSCLTSKEGMLGCASNYWLFPQNREVGIMRLTDCIPYFITGGMASSNSPTDAFDEFEKVMALPEMYALLEKWAGQDTAAAAAGKS